MGEAIVFTSGKGGVGKTTVISNIGVGLSQLDKKVVMLDTDMGLRNLDLVMGVEDRINYDLLDVLSNRCRLKQALIRIKNYPNLYVIPASLKFEKVRKYEASFRVLVNELKKEFDYCLIDCPAGIDSGFWFSVSSADNVVIVTTPHISAIKDAQRCISLLDSLHYNIIGVIVNAYDEKLIKRKQMLSLKDISDLLSINIIGSIPMDKNVIICQNKGIPLLEIKTKSKSNFVFISKKLCV